MVEQLGWEGVHGRDTSARRREGSHYLPTVSFP